MSVSKEINRFLIRQTAGATTFGEISLRARLLLGALRLCGGSHGSRPVAPLSKHSEAIQTLAPSEECAVVPPAQHGQAEEPLVALIGDRKARMVTNGTFAAHSSSVLIDDVVAVPDAYAASNNASVADGRLLLWQGNDNRGIVFNGKSGATRDRGIALFGAGSFNWYHWLIEHLPTAFLAERLGEEFRDYPLVIPEDTAGLPTFADSLALFQGDRDVETIGREPVRFGKMIVVDAVVVEPFNMTPGRWPAPADYQFSPSVMRAYREAVLDRLGIERRQPTRRLFLARRHGRRGYNQDDALEIAENYDCEATYPEDLTFKEQVQMMHDAEVVVGPSGAAFATTLFCQPRTRLLSWLLPEYRGFCSYANIAAITGCDIRYLFTPAKTSIASTRDAFSASYDLELRAFEEALKKTVEGHVGR